MWDKKWYFRSLLFLIVLLPTLIVLLLHNGITADRPLFIYEYLFLFFLMAFNVRSVWSWLIFIIVFTFDIAIVFSSLYFFNLPDFLNTFKYFNNYDFNLVQTVLLCTTLLALIGTFFLFRFLKRKIGNDKVCLRLFAIMLPAIFAIDNINGSSVVLFNQSLNFSKNNFAGSVTIMLYQSLVNTFRNVNAPLLLPMNRESIAFKEFKLDSTSNQMLVIVESFGLINDSLKREEFQKDISAVFENRNWKTNWGKTKFDGSTTRAELRELLNCIGDYRYFLKSKQAKKFKSIFQIKKEQGYHTNAIHSYKANMFERASWWKNIGADQVFFSEDVQIAFNFQSKLNYESPYISVYDEDALNFIQSKTSTTGKQFVFFLTVNAHLPFKEKLNKPIFGNFFDIDKEDNLSEEVKNQSIRVSNFLAYLANNLDGNKFQKLLIVGDHMPPFLKKSDRFFYSDQYVPYCIVTR